MNTILARTKILPGLAALVLLVFAALLIKPAMVRYDVRRELAQWNRRFPTPAPASTPGIGQVLPEILKTNRTLDAAASPWLVPSKLVVARGATLTLKPGADLVFGEKASLFVYGTLQAEGSPNHPVQLRSLSQSNAWAGLFFGAAAAPCVLRNVFLANSHYGFRAVHSTVELEGCHIYNVKEVCTALKSRTSVKSSRIDYEDTTWHSNINVFKFYKGHAEILDCEVRCPDTDLKVDAFDVDHVSSGNFRGNRFFGSRCQGADCIDLGLKSRDVVIEGNLIQGFVDKGISVGEGAQAVITNNVIAGCGQGIGIKDKGMALITHCTLLSNEVGVACFEKTAGEGGGKAILRRSILAGSIRAPAQADALSAITISDSVCDTEALPGEGNVRAEIRFRVDAGGFPVLVPSGPSSAAGSGLKNALADYGARITPRRAALGPP